MRKFINILWMALLSGWMTFNMEVLDSRGLILVEKILAENGHVTRLVEGSVVTDEANIVAFVVKTPKGSTIEIIGDKQGVREIKESWR